MLYRVQNDVRQRVFETLRLGECDCPYFYFVFERYSRRFTVFRTISVQFVTYFAQFGRTGGFVYIVEFCVACDLGKIFQNFFVVLTHDVYKFYLFVVFFPFKQDIENKLSALDTAYKAADTLINSDIAALREADTEIKASISALDTAYKAADVALQNAVDRVQTNLDNALAELRDADASNYEDLNAKLSNFENAYTEADLMLSGRISALATENEALARRVAALETLFDISSDISGDIVLLKEELAAAKEALEASDKGLRNDLTELDKVGDNRADAYLAVNIVPGVIVLALVGRLVIKPMIEKRRRKKVRLNNALK